MAGKQPVAKYLISRYGDPIFALFIGLSAAMVRIRKEESEKRSGLPSSSMVLSPAQKKTIEAEKDQRRKQQSEPVRMYTLQDYGSSETYGDQSWGQTSQRAGTTEITQVGYLEVLRLGWERIKWRTDYGWNRRDKEFERKDGRLV